MDDRVRSLGPDDVVALQSLRREALTAHPLAFGSSVEEDRILDPARVLDSFSDPGESAIFGAFVSDAIAGMIGVRREPSRKSRHRASVWGMYVRAAARGQGLGRALLTAAVERAGTWRGVTHVQLSVSEVATEARRLYESAGFAAWGREPQALRWEGRGFDEDHMVLRIRPGAD